MTLSATLAIASPDDIVDFTLTVTNDGAESVELAFRSSFTADFAVFEDGAERWRWSDDKVFMQALQSETLDSGESVAYEATWPDPEPGEYAAVATLQDEHHEVEAREEFSI